MLTTIPPAGDWAAGDADASAIARETARLAYNDDCRANYLSRGYDYLLDWEDGAEDFARCWSGMDALVMLLSSTERGREVLGIAPSFEREEQADA